MAARPPIIQRLDAALEKAEWRKLDVRAIYLDEEDQAAYDKAQSKAYGSPVVCLAYSGHQIRRGERSRIYSTHGVDINIPKQISPRCFAAPPQKHGPIARRRLAPVDGAAETPA